MRARTKADAQRALDLLIARDAGTYTAPDTAAHFAQMAREYPVVAEPSRAPQRAYLEGTDRVYADWWKICEPSISSYCERSLLLFARRHVPIANKPKPARNRAAGSGVTNDPDGSSSTA